MTQDTTSDLLDIHTAFSATEHGKVLGSRVRYERYKPQNVTNERWIELLGPDVGNLSHLLFTYELTSTFVAHTERNQPGLLQGDEGTVLQVAALIHDWAESKTGDITWGDKTAEHEAEEAAAFDAGLSEFYSGDAGDIIRRARREVIFDHDTKLGNMFNAIEASGYLLTALRAYRHVAAKDAADCEDGCKWITADVLLNQIPRLLAYAEKYSAVADYLARERETITAAFASTDADRAVFKNYGDNEAAKTAQFEQALAVWREKAAELKTGGEPSLAD